MGVLFSKTWEPAVVESTKQFCKSSVVAAKVANKALELDININKESVLSLQHGCHRGTPSLQKFDLSYNRQLIDKLNIINYMFVCVSVCVCVHA